MVIQWVRNIYPAFLITLDRYHYAIRLLGYKCFLLPYYSATALCINCMRAVEGMQYGGGYTVRRRHITLMSSTDQTHHTYGGGISSIRTRVRSTEEGFQYGSVKSSVQKRHIFSTDAGVQYGFVTPSVRWRVFSTGLPKLLRLLVVCFLFEKRVFYRKPYNNLDFILLWLNPDVAEILLAC